VGVWNALSEEVMRTCTLVTFNRHLEGYMIRGGIEGHRLSQGRAFFKLISELRLAGAWRVERPVPVLYFSLLFVHCLALDSQWWSHH